MSNPDLTPSSANGGDWEVPTTVAQRLGDAVQLLCNGMRPPEAMVVGWLDHSSEELQSFCADHGPAWAQGIGLIDAAMVMVDQPTEITTPEHQDRDHEHRAPAEAAAMVPAVDALMEQAQVLASAWSLAGGPFDFGNGMADAEEAKEELRAMIAKALSPQAPVADQSAEPSPALSADEIEQLEKAVTDFIECGETDVPDSLLQRFASLGLLECSHYNVMPSAREIIDAYRAAPKGDSNG